MAKIESFTDTTAAGTSCLITKPSGTVQGDLLVGIVAHRYTNRHSGINGFAKELSASADTAGKVSVFTKTAGASEPDTYTATVTVSTNFSASMLRISGASDILAWHSNELTLGTTFSYSAVVATINNQLTVWVAVGSTTSAVDGSFTGTLSVLSSRSALSGAWLGVAASTLTASGTPSMLPAVQFGSNVSIRTVALMFDNVAASTLVITSVDADNGIYSGQADFNVIGTGLSAGQTFKIAGIACTELSFSSSTSAKLTAPDLFANNIKLGTTLEFKVAD